MKNPLKNEFVKFSLDTARENIGLIWEKYEKLKVEREKWPELEEVKVESMFNIDWHQPTMKEIYKNKTILREVIATIIKQEVEIKEINEEFNEFFEWRRIAPREFVRSLKEEYRKVKKNGRKKKIK